MELGEYISMRRKQSGLTIDELSARSNIPKGTINKIIAGITKDPQLETVRAIAYALGFTLDDLYEQSLRTSEEPTSLTSDEYPVIAKYRCLNDSGKEYIDAQLDFALSQSKYQLKEKV